MAFFTLPLFHFRWPYLIWMMQFILCVFDPNCFATILQFVLLAMFLVILFDSPRGWHSQMAFAKRGYLEMRVKDWITPMAWKNSRADGNVSRWQLDPMTTRYEYRESRWSRSSRLIYLHDCSSPDSPLWLSSLYAKFIRKSRKNHETIATRGHTILVWFSTRTDRRLIKFSYVIGANRFLLNGFLLKTRIYFVSNYVMKVTERLVQWEKYMLYQQKVFLLVQHILEQNAFLFN